MSRRFAAGNLGLATLAHAPRIEYGDNIAGALAYFFLPAIVFVLVDPFKRSRFIRFHSFQALFLAIAAIIAGLALRLIVAVLGLIPALGQLIVLLIMMTVGIGCLVFWVVLLRA